MFNSIRRTLISALIVLLTVGASVAAATGFDDFPLSPLRSSISDDSSSMTSTSTADTLPDDSGNHADITVPDSNSPHSNSPDSNSPDSNSPDSNGDTSTTNAKRTISEVGSPTGESTTYDVAEVGTVSVAQGDGILHVTSTTSVSGWSIYVERSDAIEVEVSFRGPDGRVDFKAELERGEVRIRVRDRRLEGPSGGSSGSGDSSSSGKSSSDDPQSPTTPEEVRTVDGEGGSVTARSSGDNIILVTASPHTGWSIDIRDAGPDRVEVRFEKGGSETRIRMEASNGIVSVDLDSRR